MCFVLGIKLSQMSPDDDFLYLALRAKYIAMVDIV